MSIKIALFRARVRHDNTFTIVCPPHHDDALAAGKLVDGKVQWNSNDAGLTEYMLSELADRIEEVFGTRGGHAC